MRTSDRLLRAVKNPRLFARGFNRLYYRHFWNGHGSENSVEVFDEDWDTLVILDACRYDMFESTNQLEGTLSSKFSQGSATSEWLQANFDGRDLTDTVYVTANPQLERNQHKWDINLHETINVWLEDGWDEETGTVLAETLTEAAIEAADRYPNKRLVVHYMQPHYPFVPSNTTFDKDHLREIDGKGSVPQGENVWDKKFLGQLSISRDELWSMYVDNLEYVLDHVEVLLRHISGKTVVTSDHGNYVGERASPIPIREYGHPRGLYDDVTVRVPWLVYENGERRKIVSETPGKSKENVNSAIVSDRLRHLGYTE